MHSDISLQVGVTTLRQELMLRKQNRMTHGPAQGRECMGAAEFGSPDWQGNDWNVKMISSVISLFNVEERFVSLSVTQFAQFDIF